ncbi:hypothetical protein LIT37_12115 [Peribacillus asahii]|nr:hypothetical protein [Peribacillus asahii]USK62016.1 hypothetical protein LIT37_12115 [Peribacillus asahii]
MEIYNRYHCCASCQHFRVLKDNNKKVDYQCSRLNYQTKPNYKFDCWSPKDIVKKRMNKSL